MSNNTTSLLIVDDHDLVRDAVALLLEHSKQIGPIYKAASGEEGVKLAEQHQPDIILLDINMPGMGGIEALRKILRHQNSKVIILSVVRHAPLPIRLIELGARGYLYKGVKKSILLEAIDTVMQGHTYLDPEIARQITLAKYDESEASPFFSLTLRELQIGIYLVNAIPVSEISQFLHLSPKTVCGYRYTLFEKLNIDSDVELTQLAYRHHLLDESLPPELQANLPPPN